MPKTPDTQPSEEQKGIGHQQAEMGAYAALTTQKATLRSGSVPVATTQGEVFNHVAAMDSAKTPPPPAPASE